MLRLRDPMREVKKAFQADLRALRNPFYRQVTGEGRNAALDGRAPEDNPYPKGTEYAGWWSGGFTQAQEEIKRLPPV
jgi:hypothetical protein